jgi:recombinational DNA repair ATPase RecF
LLLDDVFSELDGSRRRALTEVISGYQTFITTTDADVVVQHFMEACNIIPLQK